VNTKKIRTIVLVAGVAGTLSLVGVACGSKKNTPPTTETPATTGAAASTEAPATTAAPTMTEAPATTAAN
jgi:hypothetical protein